MRFLHKKTVNGTKIRFTAVGRHRCRKNFNCILYYHFSRALSTACTAGKIAVFCVFLTRKTGFVFPTVGAIHESPAVSAPSERGLSNAQHLTGGEICSFLSLRLLPPAKATSLVRGRNNGAPSRRPLRTHCFLCVGNGQCPFRNSQQILRREQAPALPCKLYFVRVGNGLDRSD